MAKQSTSIKSFHYLNRHFFYRIKKIKSLRLRLNERGEFHLSIPQSCSLERIKQFLYQNQIWIEKTHFQSNKTDENQIHFLAKKYILNLDRNFKKTRILGGEIQSPSKEELELFLRNNARLIFSFYLKKWSRKTHLHYTHLSIKKMRTRWGSCNHKKGYINLNLKLLEKSLSFIEYVILHELSHIKFANHSKEFYAFIHDFMPDFKQRQKQGG